MDNVIGYIYNTIAIIGFLLLLSFAYIGFKFVVKAMSFAAELQLLEYKYNKVKAHELVEARELLTKQNKGEKEKR